MLDLERPTTVAHPDAGPIEYRLEQCDGPTVIVLHGGHMRAGLALGEEAFTGQGYSVLAPSRPGYGRTPLRTGRTTPDFADAVAELCQHLGIDHVAAVVGVSAGGHTAMATAARHPRLVGRLVLESSLGFLPWPDRRTRIAGNIVFSGRTEKATWGAVRLLMRSAPALGLRLLLGDLSTRSPAEVLAALDDEDRTRLVALFSHMRSGRGFLNDLRSTPAVLPESITQPTLVIASRKDGAVPLPHAESLVSGIPRAELLISEADSHFLWFGGDYARVTARIREFLTTDPSRSPTP